MSASNPASPAKLCVFSNFVQDNFPLSRDELYLLLQEHGIYGRRYFYPLISEFPMYADMPSSDNLSWPQPLTPADR